VTAPPEAQMAMSCTTICPVSAAGMLWLLALLGTARIACGISPKKYWLVVVPEYLMTRLSAAIKLAAASQAPCQAGDQFDK
jgi:hypothetical protein